MQGLHPFPDLQQAVRLLGGIYQPPHVKNGFFLPGNAGLHGIIGQQVGDGVQARPFRFARQLKGVFRVAGGKEHHLVRAAEHVPVFPPLVADGHMLFVRQERPAQQRFHGVAPGAEILPEQGGKVIQPGMDVKGDPGDDGRLDGKALMAEKEGVVLVGSAVDDAVSLLPGAQGFHVLPVFRAGERACAGKEEIRRFRRQ